MVSSSYLVKLSADSQNFLNTVLSSGSNRSDIFELALGKALANELNLPSSKCEDIENYFNMNVKLFMLEKIDVLNEFCPICVDKVCEDAKRFYFIRYYNVYPNSYLFINNQYPIACLFEMTKFFSNEAIDLIAKKASDFNIYFNRLNQLLCELNSSNKEDV